MNAVNFHPFRSVSYGLFTVAVLATVLVSLSLMTGDEVRRFSSFCTDMVAVGVVATGVLAWLSHASWRGWFIRIGAIILLTAGISGVLLNSLGILLGAHKQTDVWDIVLGIPLRVSLLLCFYWRLSLVRKLYAGVGAFFVFISLLALLSQARFDFFLLGCSGALIFYVFCHPEVRKEFA